MGAPCNPIELVDRYLQAVRFWMPKTQRQEDLLAELGEDLRSQIDEKEEGLGRTLDKNEVSEILKGCGAPMVVAARLGPKEHLIGPTLYPIYIFVLKMVLFWVLVPVFVFIVGPSVLASTGSVGAAINATLSSLWSGLFIAAGIITLVFAILERSHLTTKVESKWDPLELPPVRKQERKISPSQTVRELAFNWFGLVWVLLLPHYPALILGPASAFLTAGPILRTFYLPIVLLFVFALMRSAMTIAKPQWGWIPSSTQLLHTVFILIMLHFMFNAVGRMPHGQMFVALTDAARNSVQYIRVAAIVNVSILIGMAGTWLGLSIAVVVQTWQFLKYVRKAVNRERPAASLQLQ